MPKETPVPGAGVPVAGDHSNAVELSGPVVEDVSSDDDPELGSHREDDSDVGLEAGQEDGGTGESEVELPARLKGKTLAQIASEFASLEKEYSRQGNELGESRGLLRQMLEQTLKQSETAAAEDPDPTDDDFVTDPKAAVGKVVDKKTRELKNQVKTAEQRAIMAEFNAKHPGYMAEANSAEFQQWVKASPMRTRMYEAAANYDLDVADELFTEWKARKAAAPAPETVAADKRKQVAKVTTETGGAGRAPAPKSSKRIFKSTELAALYNKNREQYNSLMPEIMLAFKEGRVR